MSILEEEDDDVMPRLTSPISCYVSGVYMMANSPSMIWVGEDRKYPFGLLGEHCISTCEFGIYHYRLI